MAILWNAGSAIIQVGAFAGGLIAVVITVSIPRLMRNESTTVLILSGIVVSSLMSSIMSVIKFGGGHRYPVGGDHLLDHGLFCVGLL